MFGSKSYWVAVAASTLLGSTGTAQTVGHDFEISTFGDIETADVAFSKAGSVYLATWARVSGGVSQVRGRITASDGKLLGSTLALTSGLNDKTDPAVAYVAKTEKFLVVWQERDAGKWRIKGRTVDPITRALSPVNTLAAGTTSDAVEPALAGDLRTTENDAILVWRFTNSGIRIREIDVPSNGAPVGGSFRILTTNKADRTPAISKSGGNLRRYIVAWVRHNVSFASDNVRARALDDDGVPKGPEVVVAGGFGFDRAPAIDGTGSRFLISWEHQQSLAVTRSDILCRMLRADGQKAVLDGPTAVVAGRSDEDERHPAVAFVRNKFAIAWTSPVHDGRTAVNYRLTAPDSTRKCGQSLRSSFAGRNRVLPAIGSRYAGGSISDRAMVVYVEEEPNLGDKGRLKGRIIEGVGEGGSFTDLGGGCGFGGQVVPAGSFAIGSTTFSISLNGASPASNLALLNIAPVGPALLSCGGCEISQPGVLLPVPVAAGKSFVRLVPPCDNSFLAQSVLFQFFVLGSGTTPCPGLGGIAASNRVAGTLGR